MTHASDKAASAKAEKATEKAAAVEEKRLAEFDEEFIQAYRAKVQLAKDLEGLVDGRRITPKEATDRLIKVASMPVEKSKEPPEIPTKKSRLDEAIAQAKTVDD